MERYAFPVAFYPAAEGHLSNRQAAGIFSTSACRVRFFDRIFEAFEDECSGLLRDELPSTWLALPEAVESYW